VENIESVLSKLEKKILLIDPQMLDSLNNRVKTINNELEHISTKKSMLINTNVNAARVDKLYEKVQRWESIANQVPHVVSRLQSLKTVHDDATYFMEYMKNMKQQYGDLTSLLGSQQDLLQQVEKGYVDNMFIIEENISSLDRRMISLIEKLKQIDNKVL
jgi:dynactin-2